MVQSVSYRISSKGWKGKNLVNTKKTIFQLTRILHTNDKWQQFMWPLRGFSFSMWMPTRERVRFGNKYPFLFGLDFREARCCLSSVTDNSIDRTFSSKDLPQDMFHHLSSSHRNHWWSFRRSQWPPWFRSPPERWPHRVLFGTGGEKPTACTSTHRHRRVSSKLLYL